MKYFEELQYTIGYVIQKVSLADLYGLWLRFSDYQTLNSLNLEINFDTGDSVSGIGKRLMKYLLITMLHFFDYIQWFVEQTFSNRHFSQINHPVVVML